MTVIRQEVQLVYTSYPTFAVESTSLSITSVITMIYVTSASNRYAAGPSHYA